MENEMLNNDSELDIVWMNEISVGEDLEDRGNGHRSDDSASESNRKDNIETAVRSILANVGEDPERQRCDIG